MGSATKKLSDKCIDLLLLLINLGVLLFPLILAASVARLDLKKFIFEDYFYSSTVNKFAIVLCANNLFILFAQNKLPPKKSGGNRGLRGFKNIFVVLTIISLAITFCGDIIVFFVRIFSVDYSILRINLYFYATLIFSIISLLVNFFSIIFIKKYAII